MVANREQRLKGVSRGTCDEGLFIDILSRLSVKSFCSFKTVCKSWNGLSSDKFFAKKHLSQSRENPTFIACPSMDTEMKLYSMRPGSFELCTLNTINPAERSDEDWMYMISSFNGLICCINHISDEDGENKFCDLQIWICNPCTGETLLLPQGRPSFEVEPSVGVAYDSNISDYKVFRIFCSGKKTPEESSVSTGSFTGYRYTLGYECEVYSSRTGSWENIGPVPCAPMRACLSPFRSFHVFVGGKIFWIVSLDGKGKILSVDLEGRFEVIRLPPYPNNLSADEKITEGTYLMNLHGLLSLVILHPAYMDVWVRKQEADDFKWVCLYEDFIPFEDDEIVLAMTSSKNQILCVTETHWWSYNVVTGIWNSEMGPPSGFVNPSLLPFTESVLTCNGGVML